jgi:hypothetical protein
VAQKLRNLVKTLVLSILCLGGSSSTTSVVVMVQIDGENEEVEQPQYSTEISHMDDWDLEDQLAELERQRIARYLNQMMRESIDYLKSIMRAAIWERRDPYKWVDDFPIVFGDAVLPNLEELEQEIHQVFKKTQCLARQEQKQWRSTRQVQRAEASAMKKRCKQPKHVQHQQQQIRAGGRGRQHRR